MRTAGGRRVGFGIGFLAAVSFGVSTPLAKLLLDDIGPQLLAGLLYLGAFLAVLVALALRGGRAHGEAPLRRVDLPALTSMVIAGGVVAPLLLMLGLQRLEGVTGSLLLNLEGPFTLVIGVVVFREYLGRAGWFGALTVFAGAAVVTSVGGGLGPLDPVGVLLVVGACACWAVDNNLTQGLSVRDPFALVAVKAGAAALVNVGIGLARGEAATGLGVIVAALAVGAVAYGLSIVLDAYALRMLGATREAAIFATAPFVGAVLAVPILGETLTGRDLVGAVIMAGGVAALVMERHGHLHAHDPIEHEHRHVADAHHLHPHDPGVGSEEPHSHRHQHEPLVHAHAHVSDVHHRHSHQG